ncbi:MAG: AMP-binding protein, partial [Candidatus Rokubacteria bacterium]|nr:AMP-binding protein [Candidatus Rokubacteria bacterium]
MDIVALWAERQPDRPAIVDDERTVTWRDYHERRNRLADALGALGLAGGEHVVLYAHNSFEYLLAGAASRALGVVPVPMNHHLTYEEALYILDDADAAAVFVGDEYLATAERLRGAAPGVRAWIALGRLRRAGFLHVDDLLASGRSVTPPTPEGQGLGGSMIYTAGTTGKPKGARRAATNPAALVERLAVFGLTEPGHVHLVAGPLYHAAPGGFAGYSQLFGATLVVMPRFDPEAALGLIARHRCTSTFMAPTLLGRIVDLPAAVRARYDTSSMRSIVVAGAPCPMRVKEAVMAQFGPVLYEFYGSSELGVNTVLRPEDVLAKPGSCGRAAPGVELAVLDDRGAPVPAGTPGELHVRRGAGVFDEYWKKPEATRETARGDWLSVGDVAWIDADGFVYICDRKRDVIISGGVNIYPAEIEDALHRHPGVLDVAVFGVP